MDISFNNVRGSLYWDNPCLNYTDIDTKIIDKHFFSEMNINAKKSS